MSKLNIIALQRPCYKVEKTSYRLGESICSSPTKEDLVSGVYEGLSKGTKGMDKYFMKEDILMASKHTFKNARDHCHKGNADEDLNQI